MTTAAPRSVRKLAHAGEQHGRRAMAAPSLPVAPSRSATTAAQPSALTGNQYGRPREARLYAGNGPYADRGRRAYSAITPGNTSRRAGRRHLSQWRRSRPERDLAAISSFPAIPRTAARRTQSTSTTPGRRLFASQLQYGRWPKRFRFLIRFESNGDQRNCLSDQNRPRDGQLRWRPQIKTSRSSSREQWCKKARSRSPPQRGVWRERAEYKFHRALWRDPPRRRRGHGGGQSIQFTIRGDVQHRGQCVARAGVQRLYD